MAGLQNKPWLPDKWDYEEDVVIIGYGGTGACAAIAAYDMGSKSLILEKAPIGGGNTSTAGPGFNTPGDIEGGMAYYRALTWGLVDEELIRALAESIHDVPRWMEKLGAKPKLVKRTGGHAAGFPGADSIVNMSLGPTIQEMEQRLHVGGGTKLFQFLEGQVKKRNVKVLYETPAKKLIQDPVTREILGVRAINQRKEIFIKAKKGVILACGGFQNNPEMIHDYLPFTVGVPVYTWGTPYNTGDGILMAAEVGAKLWHMASVEWGTFGPKAAAEKFGVGFRLIRQMPSGSEAIYVNKYGKRFMNEATLLSHRRELPKIMHFNDDGIEYPNIPFFMLFDETFRKKRPIIDDMTDHGWMMKQKLYKWSEDNSAEVELGWIKKANSIKELAEKIDVSPDSLEETIRKYNENCSQNKDEFGKGKDWLAPIETPPFYATELCAILINTQGGPKHNAKAQVLDNEEKPIPRLYAGGELGSVFSPSYGSGGNNLPEAFAFGRIAGEQVAALKPWE